MDQFLNYNLGKIGHFLSIFRNFLRKIAFFKKISALLHRNDKFNITLRENLSFWSLLKIQPIDLENINPNIHIAPAKVISSFRFFKIRFLWFFFYNFFILITLLSGYHYLKFNLNWIQFSPIEFKKSKIEGQGL